MNTVGSSVLSGNYAANDLSFLTGCSALVVLLFGAMVFSRSDSRGSTRMFLALCIAASGWLMSSAFMYASGDDVTALVWARRSHLLLAFIPAAALHFVAYYVGARRKMGNAIYAVWAICALAGLSGAITTSVVPGVGSRAWGYFPLLSPWSAAEVGGFFSIMAAADYMLIRAWRRSPGEQKRRAGTLALAFVLGSTAVLDVLPSLGVAWPPIGFIGVLAFVGVAATVIWRDETIDLTPEYAASHVIETMKSAVLVIDMQGRIRVVNRATSSMLDYSGEELIGEHLRKIVDADERMSTGQLLNSKGVFEQNMAWRTRSGMRIDVLAASSYIRDGQGAPVGVVYVASDYTERKRAQEALRESEQRYRTLFDANPLPMWVYDFESLRYIAVNDAAIRHYGYSRDEFLAMSVGDLRPAEDVETVIAEVPGLPPVHGPAPYRHVIRSGAIIDVDVSSFAFETGDRRARLVIAQDVTERRRAEQRIRESEERYRGLVELSPDAILLVSRLNIVFANPAAIRFLGAESESQIVGRAVTDFVAEAERMSLNARVHVAENGIPFSTIEQRLVRIDGRGVDAELAGSGFTFEGRPAVQLVARDLSERRATEARFRLLFERNLAGVYRSTTDGRVLECNEACARIFGFDNPADMMNANAVSLYDDPADRAQILALLRGESSLQNIELRMRRRDGSMLWILENITLIPGEPGQADVLEGTIMDITARKLAQEQLEYQAYHDILTGLPNRLLFTDRIGVALAHARRKDRLAAVMFLDLDEFKTINDTLGHSVGDRLLQGVSSRLSTCVRAEDTVARMGGDEFTILLPDLADREGAIKVAEKILEAVRYPLSVDGMELYITTSVGIAMFPEDGADAEELLKSADSAMYGAKDAGRNKFKFH